MQNDFYIDSALSLGVSERSLEWAKQRQMHIVDLGTIMSMEGNRASIRSFDVVDGRVATYHGVEVLFLGTVGGGMDIIPAGTLCLLVRTAIPVIDTHKNTIIPDIMPHAGVGMKAIPLTNAYGADVHMGWDASGFLHLDTDDGISIALSSNQLSMTFGDNMLTCIDKDGTITHIAADLSQYEVIDNKGVSTRIVYQGESESVKIIIDHEDVSYFISQGGSWKEVYAIKKDSIVVTYGQNTKIEAKDGNISMQTSPTINLKMDNSSVTINGHLKVT